MMDAIILDLERNAIGRGIGRNFDRGDPDRAADIASGTLTALKRTFAAIH